jgi:glycosyltransferase involved in cell wall biosynthesis
MPRPLRLLSIGHSYCVALNRRLVNEMARESGGAWEITAVAPSFFPGDLRPVPLEADPNEACRLEGIPVHFASHIHLMIYGARLRRLLAQSWDCVHCWEEPYILSGAQTAWWTPPRVPLVYYTFQNLNKHYPPPFSWIEQYCVDRCAAWLPAGETVRDTLLARSCGYDRKPYRVMPLGVDTNLFHPDPAAGAALRTGIGWNNAGPPVVGFLGRFVPEKGLDLLTGVLDRLRTPWRALFIGSGQMEAQLRDWERSHPDNVRILTGIKHHEVPAYLNAIDLLCAPSQTAPHWREQFGRMLIEALASGVPIVASDSGEIPYVVGDAGMIVPEKDSHAWEVAIGELLENPGRRADFSSSGRQRAQSRYAWPVVAHQHLDFFESLVR